MVSNNEEFTHSVKLLIAAIVAAFIGVVFLFLAYIFDKNGSPSWIVFVLSNLGVLLIFGAGYTFISEFFLKRDFAKQLRVSIDQRLEQTRLNDSILNLGLSSAQETFEQSRLWRRIEKANSIIMVVMRSCGFFRTYYDQIYQMIKDENKTFTIVLLDPKGETIHAVVKKFSDTDEEGLKSSITINIESIIKGKIYDRLPPEKKGNLVVRSFDEIPVYSAYLFDNNELWYIPFHYRHDRRPIPVFVLKGEKLINSQLYQDFSKLITTPLSQEVNLEQIE